ncbi:DUF5606 domain-containing protein [Hymenobacter sp. BRD128]|uniref:DUF5606 family protein n=1 Tax=Hymenobacter sp. BRD128 TaxID=2675878 RepID=UPI0015651B09|nr:DUF5606 domain-containing protein [Hymenobacter sp. BRD128]QKG56645.1 DUF5606 domain-containing protein [Hymenobacter sp. BRD128]
MPYDLKELAAISGQPGLFRLVRPARHGVLVESLDAKATRSLAPASNKVSLLSEIGIYAQDSDDTLPLTEVFERIHQKHGASLPVTSKSSESELKDFLAEVMPEYDRDRVYLSDIKKLATWYSIVSQHVPYAETSADEPTAAEPLSTGGVIGEADAAPTAAGNPEATK